MSELYPAVVECLAEVYPEIPLPKRNPSYWSTFEPTSEPVTGFGPDGDILVFLAEKDDLHLVLAEPELNWWHPNIPEWDPQPRFAIPDEWQDEMTPEQRAVLQSQARKIAADRLAKYAACVKCNERMAPEHLQEYLDDGKLYCADCGNRYLGVVH